MLSASVSTGSEECEKESKVFYPAGLGLLLQTLDAAAIGAQVRHQGLVFLQQSLLRNNVLSATEATKQAMDGGQCFIHIPQQSLRLCRSPCSPQWAPSPSSKTRPH